MPFQLSESLLIQLRAFREGQRQLRAARNAMTEEPAGKRPNFIRTIANLFSGGTSVDATANEYVRSMHTWQDEIEAAHDAFLLDPGMGPMVYLTADGRILEDSRGWDGDAVVELTGDQANAALVVGAKKTGIPELLDLIPPPPPDARQCPKCKGARTAEPVEGFGLKFPCDACGSRGWIAAG